MLRPALITSSTSSNWDAMMGLQKRPKKKIVSFHIKEVLESIATRTYRNTKTDSRITYPELMIWRFTE
jgi:hypothetical protein